MKIRKVEEKPMVLHTRKKPTLHIQKKKKPAGNDKSPPALLQHYIRNFYMSNPYINFPAQ